MGDLDPMVASEMAHRARLVAAAASEGSEHAILAALVLANTGTPGERAFWATDPHQPASPVPSYRVVDYGPNAHEHAAVVLHPRGDILAKCPDAATAQRVANGLAALDGAFGLPQSPTPDPTQEATMNDPAGHVPDHIDRNAGPDPDEHDPNPASHQDHIAPDWDDVVNGSDPDGLREPVERPVRPLRYIVVPIDGNYDRSYVIVSIDQARPGHGRVIASCDDDHQARRVRDALEAVPAAQPGPIDYGDEPF